MGSILTPYSKAVGWENIYFLFPHFEFTKREKIIDNEVLKQIKILLIRLIIMFQFVERARLKN